MAYIPKDAKWYLADIVVEYKIPAEDTTIVNINLTLVRADSPEEAYALALELGKQSAISYENTVGNLVTVTFRGLRNLYVIHEELEHGSEILYEEFEDLEADQIAKLIRPKEKLSVFE